MAVGQFPNINIMYTSQYGEHNRTRVYFFFKAQNVEIIIEMLHSVE